MKAIYTTSHSPFFLRAVTLFFILLVACFLPGTLHAQWNTNTSVNIQISSMTVADMQQANTSDGKTWIAYYAEVAGNYNMMAQLIDANGYKLLGTDGVLVDSHPSSSATFVFNVCVDASNNLIIGMQDERQAGNMQAVTYKVSQTGTMMWGADGIVLGGGLAPYPAALSTGEVVIAWIESNSNTLKLQKITTNGTAAWTIPISILVGSSTTTRGQVVGCNAGKFTVVYQKGGMYTTLYAQMFDNSGTALYAPLQICTQTTAAYRYYSIAVEGDTTYFGYYSSVGNRFNSFLQRINPDGTIPWGMNGSNFNTSTGTNDSYQMTTNINHAPGSNYVWSVCTFSNPNQTIYGIYVQKFLKTTGERQLTDAGKVVYPIGTSMNTQAGDLALINDAPMFMYYISNYKIYATRLDATGNFVWPGNQVEISSTTASAGNGKMRYGFTPVGPNRCAGTWTEKRGSSYMGYAQGISIGGLTGVVVATQGSVPAEITTDQGTLQLVATVYPSTADQTVTWSIVPGTGAATISSTGLVTALANGTVYGVATAVQDNSVSDSLLITLTNQTAAAPTVVTLPATSVTSDGATVNGTVNANTLLTTASFDYGTTTFYNHTIAANPPTITGTTTTPVSAVITGLVPNTLYHYRVKGINAAGTSTGADLTFSTGNVGVGEKDALNVDISPVPNHGQFTITINSGSKLSFTLEIYNNLGVKIYGQPINSDGLTAVPVDLGSVQAGLYTVILHNSETSIIRKVSINR
ncbi:MAG: Ig-like domain-containing protein [Bacteroidota bacterium]|jgi:Bacterial Ig-like domain (group 2)/Secretion system C-terminal sorting domain